MKHYMEIFKGLRTDNDLSQQDIADVLGISQTMYARYERLANELPIRHFVTLCKYFKISADYMLGLEPPSRKKDKK